jgi:hypothetical protein
MSQQSSWNQDTMLALRHSFSSCKHSTSLVSTSCFTSQHSSWKQDTRLALCHNYQAGSTVLVISMSCFTSQHSSWKQDTRLALRHNCQAGSAVLVSSQCLALRHNTQAGSKILDWLYVTASQAGSTILLITSSCFMSQPSGWKQDTRLALRHSCQAGSAVLVSSHRLALCHNH